MRLQYGPFHYYDLTQIRPGQNWSYANNNSPSNKVGIQSCISYRITDDIHVTFHNNIINNWVNEQFAVLTYCNVYTHMHGLIFETSIWLLAGSTRFCFRTSPWTRYMFISGREAKLRSVRTNCRLAASVIHKYSTCEHKSVYTQRTCIYNVGWDRYV